MCGVKHSVLNVRSHLLAAIHCCVKLDRCHEPCGSLEGFVQSCQGHFCCSCVALLQGLAGFKVMEQLTFTTISPILQSVSGFTGACCRNLTVKFFPVTVSNLF